MSRRQRARRQSPLNLPSAFNLFVPSRNLVLDNFNVFAPLFMLTLLFWVHSWMSVPARGGHYWSRFVDANYSWPFPSGFFVAFIGFSILWFLIAAVGGFLVQVMLQDASLNASRGKKPNLSSSWSKAKQMSWQMLGLYACMLVLIVFSLFILTRRYILAPYVMLDKKCSISNALAGSAKLSNLNPGSVWGLIGVLTLIGLLGIVPFIGSLFSFGFGALYSVAPAIRYQQLKKLASAS